MIFFFFFFVKDIWGISPRIDLAVTLTTVDFCFHVICSRASQKNTIHVLDFWKNLLGSISPKSFFRSIFTLHFSRISWWKPVIVHYDTSAMTRFLTSVSLQHEPEAITLVKKTFFRTSIVRNFISRGVKMRISAREACVKPHLRTRSDIKDILKNNYFLNVTNMLQ